MKLLTNIVLICGFLFTFNYSASGGDFPVGKGANQESECDVAYNSADHEYLVVWAEFVPLGSGTTLGPVMGQRVGENGSLLADPFSIITRGANPTVTYNPKKNEYLVTAATGSGIQGQRLDSRGILLGSPVQLLEKAYLPHVAYNSLSGNYIIAGAAVVPVSPGSENHKIQIYTRTADQDGQPIGMSFLAEEYPEGQFSATKSRFAIAYAPIAAPETPTGRCLLAAQASGGIQLSMLDGEGMILKLTSPPENPGIKYRYIPFKAGSQPGGEYNVDAAYGDSSGYSMKGPAFLVVWGDSNNRWNAKDWSGIWGSFVDANKLDYLTTDSLKDNAFPISAIAEHYSSEAFASSWTPRTVFNEVTHKFIVTWHETPTNNPLNDAKVDHIRADKEFETISQAPNDVVSSLDLFNYPFGPAAAASTISPSGLIVWTDSRNSSETQWDIYGSIYTITPPSSITLIRPNGNENWVSGTEEEILWSRGTYKGSVKIGYSTDGGNTYKDIVNPALGDSAYVWRVPEVNSAKCLVKVSGTLNGDPSDVSDTTFRISGFIKTVITTSDSGAGSLRQAILDANDFKGPDTIRFNIPKTDQGYDSLHGVWYIRPVTELPKISKKGLLIDGFSQSKFLNEDSNPLGPEIVLSGEKAPADAEGLGIYADSVAVYGLTVNRFQNFGIVLLSSRTSTVSGCYVGTDYSGMKPEGNGNGIALWSNTRKAFIGPLEAIGSPGNLVSGNIRSGIMLGNYSTSNLITGNYIGVNRLAADTLCNRRAGIRFEAHCDSNLVTENIISGNSAGVLISWSDSNLISNNFIGTDKSGKLNLCNRNSGIEIANGSKSNVIRRNTIRFNLGFGVLLEGNTTIKNTITENSISQHDAPGIRNVDGSNAELAPPVITSKSSTEITGTAGAGDLVELFTDENDEGEVFIGSVKADSKGNFYITISDTIKLLKNLTATCTDTAGNTSQFSSVFMTASAREYVSGIPVRFDLRQNYPNPFNPATTIRYELPEDAFVELTLFDVTGRVVKTLLKEFRQKGYHKLNVDLGSLSSGTYFYRFEAGGFIKTLKMTLIK